MYIYIYMYVCIHIYLYTYIYVYTYIYTTPPVSSWPMQCPLPDSGSPFPSLVDQLILSVREILELTRDSRVNPAWAQVNLLTDSDSPFPSCIVRSGVILFVREILETFPHPS